MNANITIYGPKNLGLFVLHSPPPQTDPEPPGLDVVAVHGLNGDCFNSWTFEDSETEENTLWLRDMLPEKLPRVRTMTFGYNASVMGDSLPIRDYARNLLTELRKLRDSDGSQRRPIVFVGHSLGGLVIKQAICTATLWSAEFSDIISCTRGLVFFGTPHRGSAVAGLGEKLVRVKTVSLKSRHVSDLFRTLSLKSVDLKGLEEDFRPLSGRFAVVSFFEKDPFPGLKRRIVEKTSAVLYVTNEKEACMPGNHSTMIKFSRRPFDQRRFDMVWRAIKWASQDTSLEIPWLPLFPLFALLPSDAQVFLPR